jgi:hypothetical protein
MCHEYLKKSLKKQQRCHKTKSFIHSQLEKEI